MEQQLKQNRKAQTGVWNTNLRTRTHRNKPLLYWFTFTIKRVALQSCHLSSSKMAERPQKKSKEERVIEYVTKSNFVHNAFILFKKATDIVAECFPFCTLTEEQQILKQILDQMLHSILFSGHIHAKYPANVIFDHFEILGATMTDFPKPIKQYKTHVALRTPFSFLLELVTKCYGQNNESTVKKKLSHILQCCKKSSDDYPLISTVICICEISGSTYYGASLSCGSDKEQKIMTAVSCLHVWHPKVSSAVTSVFPDGSGEPHSVKLPDTVSCRAYAMEDLGNLKPPCKRCNQLYSLPNHTDNLNTAGNCAETEAISNLLKAKEDVNDRTTINGGVYDKTEIKQKMEEYIENNIVNIDDVYFPN
ncbi:uncharacterized protein LOC128615418 isoform X1 [Ictalurus furcatus]|uniref:uncharacterized protein LOC128615418 isoform X1 n=1 Tax=Ictalurus furcatus TaxID=66913 RepID=UPI00234FCB5C|nr:uncharacterized protein LOC128615418 isoform X1 [Ictalurus furcatus]